MPPLESLAQRLTSWIIWRYAAPELVLVISVPERVPLIIQRWMDSALPNATWRIAWLETGSAVLCGMAPHEDDRFLVVEHHATHFGDACVYEQHAGGWRGQSR